jgi:hypothetical protein
MADIASHELALLKWAPTSDFRLQTYLLVRACQAIDNARYPSFP